MTVDLYYIDDCVYDEENSVGGCPYCSKHRLVCQTHGRIHCGCDEVRIPERKDFIVKFLSYTGICSVVINTTDYRVAKSFVEIITGDQVIEVLNERYISEYTNDNFYILLN